jgi:hypothetical protein
LNFLGYVTQVDWTSGVNSDHDASQIFEACKEGARLDLKLAIASREAPGLAAAICALELCHDRARCKAVCCKALRIEHHSYLPRLASDDLGFRNTVERLE